MIALDTSVLVRFLTDDDPQQARITRPAMSELSEEEPGFICREVVLELAWVLERAYGVKPSRIADALDGLIATREIVVETADDIASAIAAWRDSGAGLGDRMILAAAQRAGAEAVVTFDRKAARIPGMRLLDG